MKILISGGTKTRNIIAALEEKYSSSGMDFIATPYIEEIPDIFQRGEYFDRAIIIEQCWTHDNPSTTEQQIRRKINEFALDMASRNLNNTSFVFLTQEESQATIVYEESLPIQADSIIVVKKPTYYVRFFQFLVTAEFSEFPDEIVYKDIPEEEDEPEEEGEDTTEPSYDTGNPNLDFEDEKSPNRLRIDTGSTPDDIPGEEEWDLGVGGDPWDADIGDDFWGEAPTPDQDQGQGDQAEPMEPMEPEWPHTPEWEADSSWEGVDQELEGDLGFEFGGDPELEIGPEFESDQGLGVGQEEVTPDEWTENPSWTDEGGAWEEPIQSIEAEGLPVGEEGPIPSEPYDAWSLGEQRSDDLPDFSGESEQEIDPFSDPEFKSPDEEYIDGQDYVEPVDNIEPALPDDSDYQDTSAEDMPGFDQADYENDSSEIINADSPFKDSDYESDRAKKPKINRKALKNNLVKATFDAFASRGNSILVTGCGGCGTSTIAMNLANTICNMGYNVLLVDMDTKHKTQSYISREHYDSLDPDTSAVISAVNSATGMTAHEAIVRQGYHLLTMGMASDERDPADSFNADRLSRFANLAKTSENFVIYDVPFESASTSLNTLLITCDNLVINVDASNWGVVKTMLSICNIDDDDIRDIIFNKGQLLFNRYRGLHRVLGKKVRNAVDITKAMDKHVIELIGEDPGNYFADMHICGIIQDDPNFEDGWFNNSQYSDTPKGNALFLELLKNIVLHT